MKKLTPLKSWVFFALLMLILIKLFNLVEDYPKWMTYRNMDVPGQRNFINYLAPGVKDAISGTKYKFGKNVKTHTTILMIVLFFFFPLMLFARAYKSLDFKLGVKRWLTAWLVFVAARVGIFRVTAACPVKRSSLGVFPFINCQSCELATGACPVGTFQMSLLNGKIPFLAITIVILIGALLGRWICGWICPFGFLSDIFDRFSKHKKLPKKLGYLKFVILGLVIISAIYMFFSGKASILPFCAFLCSGGFFYGILPYYVTTGFGNLKGPLPFFHALVIYHLMYFAAFIVLAYKYSGRIFCKYLCPLGAAFGLFNRIAFVRVEHDKSKCSSCGACNKVCQMEADLCKNTFLDRANCISCARCVKICSKGARYWNFDIKKLFGNIKILSGSSKQEAKSNVKMKKINRKNVSRNKAKPDRNKVLIKK